MTLEQAEYEKNWVRCHKCKARRPLAAIRTTYQLVQGRMEMFWSCAEPVTCEQLFRARLELTH